MLGVLMLVSSSLHAQDPAEELKLFIKAQQAKMDEQSKVLEQQKILILEQSKLLKQQTETQNQLTKPEIPSTPKFSLEPEELQKLPKVSGGNAQPYLSAAATQVLSKAKDYLKTKDSLHFAY